MSIESATELYCAGDGLHDAVEAYVTERVMRDCAFKSLVKRNPRLLNRIVEAYIDLEYDDLQDNFLAELRDDA